MSEPPAAPPLVPPAQLKKIQQLLVRHSGLLFDKGRESVLIGGVIERMRQRHLESAAAYSELLDKKASGLQELQALIDVVTIGETYFFRNLQQFNVLRNNVLPQVIHAQSSRSPAIKIWSAGCATGEEPYSIAMLLLEALPNPERWKIEILATDINRDFLTKAQQALYRPRAIKDVPQDWLKKYFSMENGLYRLADEVKRLVRFSHHNLISDPFSIAGMQEVDVLFHRNVTIYFTLETTKRLMDQFADCLHEGGYLFIGHAETLWKICDQFTVVEFPHTVVYRKASAQTSHAPKPLMDLPQPAFFIPSNSSHAHEPKHKDGSDSCAAEVGKAALLADQGKYEEAITLLSQALEVEKLSSRAQYLLGVLYSKANRLLEAATAFERALYIDPNAALAYVGLAQMYQCQAQSAKARRAFGNAVKVLEGLPADAFVELSEDISCGDLRAACARALEQLQSNAGSE